MKFIDISGFEKEKDFLINAANKNHVAHAQLFFGSEGSPNLSLALAFISFLNCNNKISNDSCGECPSCKKIDKMIHPDVHFIFPVAPTTKINKNVISDLFIKEWRNFILDDPYQNVNDWFNFYGFENKSPNISKDESRNLIKKLTLKPFESENKIVLIWLPEYLHLYTSNALLKILEDPPPKTFFFLITNDYNRLLKTILSRVQMFKIRNFSDEELTKEILKKDTIAESELSKVILTLKELFPLNKDKGFIGIYWPINDEIDLRDLKKNKDFSIALPSSNINKKITYHPWLNNDLKEDIHGIPAPLNTPPLKAEQIKLLLVPALAIDHFGYRLGYGGGYFDRLRSQDEWKRINALLIVPEVCISLTELP